MHRYIRTAEVVAVAILAAAFSFSAALPHVLPASASRPDLITLPTVQRTIIPERPVHVKCSRGKPPTAWGAWIVPADTECLETAKTVGVVFRGAMQFDKAEAQFRRAVKEAGTRKIAFLRIASGGGDSSAGFAISAWLREHKDVQVIVNGDCHSACSLATLGAGKGRITLVGTGKIGLHQGFNAETGQLAPELMKRVVAQFKSLGVPQTAIAGMLRTMPEDIYIMTPAELAGYGVKTS